jgi:hypothetical protein
MSEVLHPTGSMNAAKWRWVLAIWLCTVFGVAALAAALHHPWTPPGEPPNLGNRLDQCEALNLLPNSQSGIILEVQNTWSNAAYLLVGLLILACSTRPLGLSLGGGLVLLSFCSGLYHATLQDNSTHTFDARSMDIAAMYFVLWLLLGYAVLSVLVRRRWSPAAEWRLAAAMAVAAYVMARIRYYVWLFSSTTAVLIMVAVITTVYFWQMRRRPTRWKRFYLAVFGSAGAIAAFFRFGDGGGRFLCEPHAFIQPHSIWHVASAALVLLAYDFFARSSRPGPWADWPVFP